MKAATLLLFLLTCGAPPSPRPTVNMPEVDPHWRVSDPDALGRRSCYLVMPFMPVNVRGGSEAYVYRRAWEVPLPEELTIVKVSTFIGLDRGDIVEADIELRAKPSGFWFYQRSLHKELWYMTFEAWETKAVAVRTEIIEVSVVCRVNGKNRNQDHPRYGTLTARVHFGVVLVVEQ